MASMFAPASRKRIYLKVGITGPSGSAKSWSAILLARGLAGPEGLVAAVDTENGSLSLYSHLTPFLVVDLEPPYAPQKYIAAIRDAEANGVKVLIIDSFTHAWKFLLDKKEKLDAAGRGGDRNNKSGFANWGPVKAEAEELKNAILQSKMHIVCCMRSKTDYAQEGGKVIKVGMASIQEPDVEYEFTTVFAADMAHNVQQSKDRTGLFQDRIFQVTVKTGEELLAWLDSADSQEVYVPPAAPVDLAPSTEVHPLVVARKRLVEVGCSKAEYQELLDALAMAEVDLVAFLAGMKIHTPATLLHAAKALLKGEVPTVMAPAPAPAVEPEPEVAPVAPAPAVEPQALKGETITPEMAEAMDKEARDKLVAIGFSRDEFGELLALLNAAGVLLVDFMAGHEHTREALFLAAAELKPKEAPAESVAKGGKPKAGGK